jgi:hypothetical protein
MSSPQNERAQIPSNICLADIFSLLKKYKVFPYRKDSDQEISTDRQVNVSTTPGIGWILVDMIMPR